MWTLKITHLVEQEVREFTRTSDCDHSWEYVGDGFWQFFNEDDEWSGVFKALVIIEDHVAEDGSSSVAMDGPGEGEVGVKAHEGYLDQTGEEWKVPQL